MNKNFSELRAKMSPEAHAIAAKKTEEIMEQIKSTQTISDDVPLDVRNKTIALAQDISNALAQHEAAIEFVFDPREQFLKIRIRFKDIVSPIVIAEQVLKIELGNVISMGGDDNE